jgi:hypothetical protein
VGLVSHYVFFLPTHKIENVIIFTIVYFTNMAILSFTLHQVF